MLNRATVFVGSATAVVLLSRHIHVLVTLVAPPASSKPVSVVYALPLCRRYSGDCGIRSALPYPMLRRLFGAPQLHTRVFSRKHDCTRCDAANWQPSCAIAGFLRTTRLRQANMCLQARKHICKRASQSQTRCLS